ncbi:hypothetical protein ACJDU8_17820 [Clostridium sp. WILCCON 0269]|uniref:Uncharacterized protein n=1 Tax=Candidatus Clostridium eludens TaxID=3381663 RepID=A0ABW8SN69_9CLOT
MNTVTISILISTASIVIAFISLLRLFSKDGKEDTQNLARIEAKLDFVGGDVKEMRDDIKILGVNQTAIGERLAKVEESSKSAHHRIDSLEGKKKEE